MPLTVRQEALRTPTTPTDEAYAAQLHYWTTPQTKCVDGSGNDCTGYDQWVTKWQEIKG